MNRGEGKNVYFKIKKFGTDEYIDCSQFSEIEVQINDQHKENSVKKLMSKNEVKWENDKLVVFFDQKDTFKLSNGSAKVQIRVFRDGMAFSTMIKMIDIGKSLSSDIIGGGE